MDIKKETLNGVKWSAIGKYSNLVLTFIIGIILARLLDPSDYGTLSMISIFFVLSNLIIDGGFGTALLRKNNAAKEDFSTVFFFNFFASSICYLLLFLCAPYIAIFFELPILNSIVRVSGLTMVIGALGSVQYIILKKELNFKYPSIISVIATFVSGIIGIWVAIKGYGVWALVAQSLVSSIVRVSLVWMASKWRPSLSFSFQSFKELFSFGGKYFTSLVIGNVYDYLRPLLIGKFYTPASLGYLNKGNSSSSTIYSSFFGVIDSVTLPIMVKVQDDDERLIHVYSRYIKVISVFICFVMSLAAALAKPFTLFLYTDKWEPAVIFMQIGCLALLTAHVNSVNQNLLIVKGRSDYDLKTQVIRKIIWTIGLIVSLPISVLAVAIMGMILSNVSLFVNAYYTGKVIDFGYWKQAKLWLPYVVISLLSCLPAYLLTFANLHHLVCLILGGTLSTCIYASVLWLKRDENFIDLINLLPIKKLIKKYR